MFRYQQRKHVDPTYLRFRKSAPLPLQVGLLTFLPVRGRVSFTVCGISWKGLAFTFCGLGGFLSRCLEVFSNAVEEVESVFCLGAHFSVLCFPLFLLSENKHTM